MKLFDVHCHIGIDHCQATDKKHGSMELFDVHCHIGQATSKKQGSIESFDVNCFIRHSIRTSYKDESNLSTRITHSVKTMLKYLKPICEFLGEIKS